MKVRPLTRRVLLASAAFGLGCYYLLDRLPVDRDEFLGYVTTSLLLVGGLVIAAFVVVAVIKLLGKLFKS